MPFVAVRTGPSASPILPPRKGILGLRHAHISNLIGGSRLSHIPLEKGDGERPFDEAGLDLVEIDSVPLHRLKLASIWLRIEQVERLGKGDLSRAVVMRPSWNCSQRLRVSGRPLGGLGAHPASGGGALVFATLNATM